MRVSGMLCPPSSQFMQPPPPLVCRERERAGEKEKERGGERPTEQESGANQHCGRVVGSSGPRYVGSQ